MRKGVGVSQPFPCTQISVYRMNDSTREFTVKGNRESWIVRTI